MTIPLTGTGGLFTREGRFGFALRSINTFQGSTVPSFISSIMAQFDGDRTFVDDVPALESVEQSAVSTIMPTIQTDALTTLQGMVKDDYPALSATKLNSVIELIEQVPLLVGQMVCGPLAILPVLRTDDKPPVSFSRRRDIEPMYRALAGC